MSSCGRATVVAILRVFFLGIVFAAQNASAEGTDILEPSSAVIAEGSGIIGAGVGLSLAQPGDISITIPEGAIVRQVLIYWDGADRDYAGAAPIIGVSTDTIDVSGNLVEGVFIGGRTFGSAVQQFTFRADITALGLVSPGSNTLTVSGLDFGNDSVESGAGLLAIIDEGTPSSLSILDGSDYAYAGCTEDFNCQVTVKRAFTFPPSSEARDADLTMFFTSVAGAVSGGAVRPSTVRVWVGAAPPIEIVNKLDSADRDEWDTLDVEFEVPAGVTQVEVQAFSEDLALTNNDPASFKWLTAALSIPNERDSQNGDPSTNDVTQSGQDSDNGPSTDTDTSSATPVSTADVGAGTATNPAVTANAVPGGGGSSGLWELLFLAAFGQWVRRRSISSPVQ